MIVEDKPSCDPGERFFNLPAHFLSYQELAEAYLYAAKEWGKDSWQARDILKQFEHYSPNDIEELEKQIQMLHYHIDDYGELLEEIKGILYSGKDDEELLKEIKALAKIHGCLEG